METIVLKTNDFRFLLTMPDELNTAIETVAFSQCQSKSEFIREGLRRYLREVEFNGLLKKREETDSTRSSRLIEVHQCPWGLFVAWFCVSLGSDISISVLLRLFVYEVIVGLQKRQFTQTKGEETKLKTLREILKTHANKPKVTTREVLPKR